MKILKKIIYSTAILLIVLVGLEKIYDFFLKNNLYLKQSFVLKKKIDSKILILGNCVPLTLLNPSIIETKTHLKTYNLAEYHSNIAENYLSFYLYLKKNKAPNYLIVYTSPESFDLNINIFNSSRFSLFLSDLEVKKTIKELDPSYYKWTFIPFMKYGYNNDQLNYYAIQGVKKYFTSQEYILLENGFSPITKVIKYKSSYKKGYIFNWDDNQSKYLKKMIELAKKNKTKVILFESPILKSTLKHQPNRNHIIQKIKRLSKSLSINFIQFDNTKISLDKKNFISSVSLNKIAGSAFIEILIDSLNFK